MKIKQIGVLFVVLGTVLLLASLPALNVTFDVNAQTIPTVTPVPSNPTSPPSNPTSPPSNPTSPPPSNPTATSFSPVNPTATLSLANPTATDDFVTRTPTATPTDTRTPQPTATATTAGTTATARARAASAATATALAEEEEETPTAEAVLELATASPIPDQVDETIAGAAETVEVAEALPEETEGGSLLWVLLLGVGLVAAATILFITGRRQA